jgi:hypothetical protein
MTLEEQLQVLRAQSAQRLGPEAAAAIARARDELVASGFTKGARREGEQAPGFTLRNPVGHGVSLADLLARGPVVVTFYRGGW